VLDPYSQLRVGKRQDLAAAVPLVAPLAIYIEPTNLCNFKCNMCPHSLPDFVKRAGSQQLMLLELYTKVVEDLRVLGGVKSLKLYHFGEPMMHPDFGVMAHMAKDVAERVETTSNGTLLDRVKAEELIASGLDYIRFSIYGVTEQQHIRITGSENPKFFPEKIRENIRMLRNLRDSLGRKTPFIATQMLNHSDAERQEFEAFYAGVSDECIGDKIHNLDSNFVPMNSLTRNIKKACPYPFYTLVVRASGEVVPCCCAWERSLILGDINTKTLQDIWEGEKLRNLQRDHLSGKRSNYTACASCDALFNSPDSVDHLTIEEYDAKQRDKWMPGKPKGFLRVKYSVP